jgi:CBS domain-containing protein
MAETAPPRHESVATVASAMVRDVLTVRADQPVDDAALIIVEKRITGLAVVDADNRCVGIVSESDVLSKRGDTVGDVMTTDVISVDEETPLDEAAEIMLTSRVRRLPVIRDGRLVGLLSRADLVREFRNTRWVCAWCGREESGLRPPNACPGCGGESFSLSGERRS